MKRITQGPFAGTEIPADQLRKGVEGRLFWPTRDRTPLFLERFRPPQYRVGLHVIVRPELGEHAVEFQARLLDEQDRPINTASTLILVSSQVEWEIGETIARGRLYDAMGLALPTEDAGTVTMPTAIAEPAVRPVDGATESSASTTEFAPLEVEASLDEMPAATVQPMADESDPQPVRTEAAVVGIGVDPQLLRILSARAASVGIPVPTVKTNDEARQAIKDVLQRRVQ